MDKELKRRTLFKVGAGLTIGAIAARLPKLAVAAAPEIQPGSVHLELGRHSTFEDARKRFAGHLESDRVPTHFVNEALPYQLVAAKFASEEEFVELSEHLRKALAINARALSNGKQPPLEIQHIIADDDFMREKYRLLREANRKRTAVKVLSEPFSEKAARAEYQSTRAEYDLEQADEEGNLQAAMNAVRKHFEWKAKSIVSRDKYNLGLVQQILKQEPGARILWEYGSGHEYVEQLLRKKGINVTKRKTSLANSPTDEILTALVTAGHGLSKQPNEFELDEMHKRALIYIMLRRRLPEEKALAGSWNVKKDDLEELFQTLRHTKEPLGERAITWLQDSNIIK